MASSNDDDSPQRFALGLLAVLITIIIACVIGFAVFKSRGHHVSAPPAVVNAAAPATPAAPADVIPEGASIRVEDGVVKFYFASGSADIAPNAAEALTAVLAGLKEGKKAVISGYHDTTGDAAQNEELAKNRAQKVQEVLLGLGAAADKVVLEKPEASTGTGSNAQARRVEVKLID